MLLSARMLPTLGPLNLLPLQRTEEDAMSTTIGEAITLLGMPPWKEAKRMFERTYCEKLLQETGGNVLRAARTAGTDRKHLYEIMRRCGVKPADFR